MGAGLSLSAALCFIIQNEKEVTSQKRTTPMGTIDLNSYISVKFVTNL